MIARKAVLGCEQTDLDQIMPIDARPGWQRRRQQRTGLSFVVFTVGRAMITSHIFEIYHMVVKEVSRQKHNQPDAAQIHAALPIK
jgi:hypothetical protein